MTYDMMNDEAIAPEIRENPDFPALVDKLATIAATQVWLDKVISMYAMARLSGWDDKGAGAVVLQKLNRGE